MFEEIGISISKLEELEDSYYQSDKDKKMELIIMENLKKLDFPNYDSIIR